MSRIGHEVEKPRQRARLTMLGFGLIVLAAIAGLIILLAVLS